MDRAWVEEFIKDSEVAMQTLLDNGYEVPKEGKELTGLAKLTISLMDENQLLSEQLRSIRADFAAICRAVKQVRGHSTWPVHHGPFVDFVVSEVHKIKGEAHDTGRTDCPDL